MTAAARLNLAIASAYRDASGDFARAVSLLEADIRTDALLLEALWDRFPGDREKALETAIRSAENLK